MCISEPCQQIDEEEVDSLEDLAPAIELYNTLIGLGRYDDAYEVFSNRLTDTMYLPSGYNPSA